jgi:multidrug resistance efflux pump
LLLLLPILLVMGALAANFGYRYWYDATYFVMTDNAQVAGDLVQVGSLNAGRLIATRVEVGDQIQQGQEIATVGIPQQVGAVPMGGAPIVQDTGASDARVPIRAPLSGIVAARLASAGGTVAAGQPIYAVVDPNQVWVKANIEEDKVARLQVGQAVEVHVDTLGRSFAGRVDAIAPASAATFSLLPSGNASGNYTKVTQLVPVKIVVDSGDAILRLGTSVEVRIQVRQPIGGVPWQP